MSIVLRENEWAECMIQSKSLGKKPSETLRRVARYYIDLGYSKREIRDILETFLIQCKPAISLAKWDSALDYAIKRAYKFRAINIEYISVSESEMDKIHTIKSKQIQRLAFTLLCLSKYWMIVVPSGDGWVNNNDSEIMAMANINTSLRRQCAMYGYLRENDFIQFSKKVDNTNVKVLFGDDGDEALRVSDFRNLGYQYMKFYGGPYVECQNCGITTKIENPHSGRTQKYCKDCASDIAMQQIVNSVMRDRMKKRTNDKVFTVYMHVSPAGKRYIGVTSVKDLSVRWKNGMGYIENRSFYSDIMRYGWDSFDHYVIATTTDEKEAKNISSAFISKYKSNISSYGYNRSRSVTDEFVDLSICEAYIPYKLNNSIPTCGLK